MLCSNPPEDLHLQRVAKGRRVSPLLQVLLHVVGVVIAVNSISTRPQFGNSCSRKWMASHPMAVRNKACPNDPCATRINAEEEVSCCSWLLIVACCGCGAVVRSSNLVPDLIGTFPQFQQWPVFDHYEFFVLPILITVQTHGLPDTTPDTGPTALPLPSTRSLRTTRAQHGTRSHTSHPSLFHIQHNKQNYHPHKQ
jgi:hypothetical protein